MEKAIKIFNENYKHTNIEETLNYFIKFLKKYLKTYLSQVRVRSLKVERHVNRIIDKIIFLKFLKHARTGLNKTSRKTFLLYFKNEKVKLMRQFSISQLNNPIENNKNNNPIKLEPVPSFVINTNFRNVFNENKINRSNTRKPKRKEDLKKRQKLKYILGNAFIFFMY